MYILLCNWPRHSVFVVTFRIIATPGRLMHILVEMNLKLQSVEYVVFDEADRFATSLCSLENLFCFESVRRMLLRL